MGTRKTKRYRVREHQLYTVTPGVWRRLRRDNTIDEVYRFRARKIGLASRIFHPASLLQKALFDHRIRRVSLEGHPPLFILGLWRSGTTHLHYLLARDPRFGFLKNHQAFAFNMALLSLDRLNRILNLFLPGRRPQDNMQLTLDDPAEEEQPLCTFSVRSSIHSFFFPRNQRYFTKYHLFDHVTEKEKSEWKRDYLHLLRHIAFYSRRKDLLLKNPHNTGRVRELLELFPGAKFIFLHRDPYTVYRSTKKLYTQMISSQFLQFVSQREMEDLIIGNNARIMEKYLKERSLIPEGHLAEVGFEELEKDPIATVERIYRMLGIGGLDAARPQMEAYLESVKHYRKNRYRPVSGKIRERIRKEWELWFRAFGYPE